MPHLHVYRSNRLEALGELLATLLAELAPEPFERIEVVVGSRGMERWLRHRLAERISVCANVEFPFPEAKIDAIVAAVLGLPEAGERDPWAVDTLPLALLEVLPQLAAAPGCELLQGDVERWDGPIDARQYGLARQLADVFDRYVNYRPDLAQSWSAGQPSALFPVPEAHSWQFRLWGALREQLSCRPHRAERLASAVARLASEALPASLRAPLRIFGVTSLPPAWMLLLGALAQYVDVDLFLLCPSAEYWAELGRRVRQDRAAWRLAALDSDQVQSLAAEAGNPLLASMGRVAQDAQIVLESQAAEYEEQRLDLFHDPVEPARPRLLHWLQSDILTARHPAADGEQRNRQLEPGDDSVQFHSCHGPTRQVEVLRDVLLGLLQDYPELEPREIVVMTPDIEKYAPLAAGVFSQGRSTRLQRDGEPVRGAEGWGPIGGPQIPIEVTDLSVRRQNPIADALLRLLELADGRLEASAVLDLITLDPVARRFDIQAGQLTALEGWIRDSGIRWGHDAAHRAEERQPADPQNTWSFGLRRLLLGVVMADDGRLLRASDPALGAVRPFDAMEGAETVLLGKFVDFTNSLFSMRERLRQPRPLLDWVQALEAALDSFTSPPADGFWLARRVREELEQLREQAQRANSRRRLGLDALRRLLAGRFEVASQITKEQSGAVTFCAMKPMRSVPYRVVCLLGMDEAVFPRQADRPAFDLVAQRPRVGDHNPRDEDRYLMLEAILAARSHLVVLYTGRDPHTNQRCPPCVPVAQLCDAVDQTCTVFGSASGVSQRLTTEHPLQPFSPRAFWPLHPDPHQPGRRRPWSFDRRLLVAAEAWQNRLAAAPPLFAPEPLVLAAAEAPVEIQLDELVRFFKNPIEYLLRHRLGLDLSDRIEPVPDREPIELGALEAWQLGRALLDERLAGREIGPLGQRLRAAGSLPLGYAGQAALERTQQLVDAMLSEAGLRSESAGALVTAGSSVPVELGLGRVRVTGCIDHVYGNLLTQLHFAGSENARQLASLWLPLLAWRACCSAAGRALLVLGKDSAAGPQVSLVGYEAPADARGLLAELVEIYQRGLREPIPVFPAASWVFAKTLRRVTTEPGFVDQLHTEAADTIRVLRQAHQAAVEVWSRRGYGSDLDDPYIARTFEGQSPLVDVDVSPVPLDRDFARLALTLWGPLWKGRVTGRVVKSDWLAAEGA